MGTRIAHSFPLGHCIAVDTIVGGCSEYIYLFFFHLFLLGDKYWRSVFHSERSIRLNIMLAEIMLNLRLASLSNLFVILNVSFMELLAFVCSFFLLVWNDQGNRKSNHMWSSICYYISKLSNMRDYVRFSVKLN